MERLFIADKCFLAKIMNLCFSICTFGVNKQSDITNNYDYIRENLKPGNDLYFWEPFYDARLRLTKIGDVSHAFVWIYDEGEKEIERSSELPMNVMLGGEPISKGRHYE
ncbi:MAG: hypothetical protein IK131_08085 [Paludibacteraceae bacterium]|nr:hypothetical protein [Paludibacteraceae bacterium]